MTMRDKSTASSPHARHLVNGCDVAGSSELSDDEQALLDAIRQLRKNVSVN